MLYLYINDLKCAFNNRFKNGDYLHRNNVCLSIYNRQKEIGSKTDEITPKCYLPWSINDQRVVFNFWKVKVGWSHTQCATPSIAWVLTGSIFETDVKIIKDYFDQFINQW